VTAQKLRLEAVSKRFFDPGLGEEADVLQSIDFSVRSGEFVAVVGPSGCGKSTLLHIIAGLLKPTSGRVVVDDRVVTAPGPDRVIAFQNAALLPWRTALDNVVYGLECLKTPREPAMTRARACLDLVGLAGFAQHYPHELSEGMKQRVNLARALAVEPDILLMDEPFAALDDETREAMQWELLGIWHRSRQTVLFVTHQIAEALFLADRVVVLSHRPGRILEMIGVELPRPRDDSTRRSAWLIDAHDHIRRLLVFPSGSAGHAASAGVHGEVANELTRRGSSPR
jgi:NitT/TauT family transport system ATP-binding protein